MGASAEPNIGPDLAAVVAYVERRQAELRAAIDEGHRRAADDADERRKDRIAVWTTAVLSMGAALLVGATIALLIAG